ACGSRVRRVRGADLDAGHERTPEMVDRSRKSFVETDARRPLEQAARERNVRTPLPRIVAGRGNEDDRRARSGELAHALGEFEHRELAGIADVDRSGAG